MNKNNLIALLIVASTLFAGSAYNEHRMAHDWESFYTDLVIDNAELQKAHYTCQMELQHNINDFMDTYHPGDDLGA